jgi:hypothetical protein
MHALRRQRRSHRDVQRATSDPEIKTHSMLTKIAKIQNVFFHKKKIIGFVAALDGLHVEGIHIP